MQAELKNHLQQVVGNPEPEDVTWVKVADSSLPSEGTLDTVGECTTDNVAKIQMSEDVHRRISSNR